MTRRFLNHILLFAILFVAQISARADLLKSSVLESDVTYLRVGEVGKNLAEEIQSAQNALPTTNKIVGTVLDLRFADGDDLDSEKAAANLFAQTKLPLAILVNSETAGAAIELAKQLRAAHAGLIFGSSTELTPDISISVNTADEKSFLENPFGTLAAGETNSGAPETNFLPFIDHTTEADLVRAKIKDGDEDDAMAEKAEPQKPFIRDPVLARGVDFIKGEAILRLSHS